VRLRSNTELAALAALAYLPFLASDPGRVSADSKQDLYLDPGGLLARSVDLWDPQVGAGTVPHQGLGYLFPTAPWFWAMDVLGVPDWVAQRLWWGTLTLAALLGARTLLIRLGTGRAGALAGALVYGLSPYQLAFTARISVLLLPWAALPWLVGLAIRVTRGGGWRAPALFAVVLALAGGVNASSLLLVLLAPALWVGLELLQRADRRAVAAATGRAALLAVGISAWWLVGLRIQGAYGLPVLQLTEDVRTVAVSSTPGDVLRGLGNWFFYGRDRTDWSLDQAEAYATDRLVLVATYAVPAAALGAAVVLRWAHKAYFGLLVVTGTVVAVGAWPLEDPTPWGRAWRSFTDESSLGLAFRNSPRVVPVVVLGLAGLLGAAVGAVPAGRRRLGAAGAAGALALAALLPVWSSGYLTDGMLRDEEIPGYWRDAAASLDADRSGTRVLEVPGSSFAAYSWGTTVDPVLPGLIDRPHLAREVLPAGTPGTVDLLDALDRRFQLGIVEPEALAPLARLLGVGTIVLRGDLDQSGRFDAPPIGEVWEALVPTPPGLVDPELHGPGEGSAPGVPGVALFDVEDPRPIVRSAPAGGSVVLAGDGDGIVDAAAAGLLDGRSLVLAASALDDGTLSEALASGADLVLTDTNRRRIETWFYSIRDTKGPTERAGEVAEDPTGYDFRLDPFPGIDDDHRSVVEHVGGRVEGTGGRGPEAPEDRPSRAVDGDPATFWRVSGPDVAGHHVEVVFDDPVPADEVRIRLAPTGPGDRRIERLRVEVDGRSEEVAVPPAPADELAVASPGAAERVRVTILATGAGRETPVGLAEVRVAEARVDETVRLPVDLLRRAGRRSADLRLDVVLTRLRTGRQDEGRRDEEHRIDRRFELPSGRAFALRAAVPATDVDGWDGRCRDDLVSVDGRRLPVRLASTEVGPAGHAVVEGCEPLALGAGSHRVVAAPAGESGVDLDRVVLSSGPEGEPAEIGLRGDGAGPVVEVVEEASDRVVAVADPDGSPFWFVLAQSHSSGWALEVEGGQAGPQQLVDGYANAWRIDPDGTGAVTLTARWTPQRLVWLGLAVSAATLVGTLVLLGRTRRGAGPVPSVYARPRLAWRGIDPVPSRARQAVALAGVAGLGLLVAPPAMAVLGTLTSAVAASGGRLRFGLVILPGAALLLSRLVERPSIAWLAVLVLLAEVLVDARGIRRPRSPAPPARAR
jgi:arabinofuranan 3-O-arabinosyltransferase